MRPAKSLKLSSRGLQLVKDFELFVPHVYDDLVPARMVNGKLTYPEWKGGKTVGVLTIGYGHTDKGHHPLKISKGLRVTEAEASKILDVDLDLCERAVQTLVKVPISQGIFDALTSFAFNCGTGALRKVVSTLNQGKYDAACDRLGLYVKARKNGKLVTLRGLVRRREAEQDLWKSTYYSTEGVEPGYSCPKDVVDPDDVAPPPRPIYDEDTVKQVQEKLRELGYFEVGLADKDLGSRTQGAILAFRNDNGLPLTPEIDMELLVALETAQKRHISRERQESSEEAIASRTPGVRPSVLNRLVGQITGLVAAVSAGFWTIAEFFQEKWESLYYMREFFSDIPVAVWIGIAFGASLIVYYNGKRSADEVVEAYREGRVQ